jgi:hypothetical protein
MHRNSAGEGPPMNTTKSLKAEGVEAVREARERHDSLSNDEKVEDNLTHLETYVRQLSSTAHGKAELDRRKVKFGPCTQLDGESRRDYFGRLRTWLDRDL